MITLSLFKNLQTQCPHLQLTLEAVQQATVTQTCFRALSLWSYLFVVSGLITQSNGTAEALAGQRERERERLNHKHGSSFLFSNKRKEKCLAKHFSYEH